MAAALYAAAVNSIWHTFDALDERRDGHVPKSNLKLVVGDICQAIRCPNASEGLSEFHSTSTLQFDDFLLYLNSEVFVDSVLQQHEPQTEQRIPASPRPTRKAFPLIEYSKSGLASIVKRQAAGTPLEQEFHRHLAAVEAVCWKYSRSKYVNRFIDEDGQKRISGDETHFSKKSSPLSDDGAFQIFRIFCLLSELRRNEIVLTQEDRSIKPDTGQQVLLSSEDTEVVICGLLSSLGRPWDAWERRAEYSLTPGSWLPFSAFLSLLDTAILLSPEMASAYNDCVYEVYETLAEDVLRKGILYRPSRWFSRWKPNWFVLRPWCLVYYSDRTEKRKRGEIAITGSTSIQPVPDTPRIRGKKFVITTGEESMELVAPDNKTKMQWILAIQTAIDYNNETATDYAPSMVTIPSYQRRLAARRRSQREAERARRREAERTITEQRKILECKQQELEVERLARQAAEAAAHEAARQRECETAKLRDIEEKRQELERLLQEERQAKQDEEIVINLQARVLREEWERREELEQAQNEQQHLLDQAKTARVSAEEECAKAEQALSDANKTITNLQEKVDRLCHEIKEVTEALMTTSESNMSLEKMLKSAEEKAAAAERVKENLESKLRHRERSQIPVLTQNPAPKGKTAQQSNNSRSSSPQFNNSTDGDLTDSMINSNQPNGSCQSNGSSVHSSSTYLLISNNPTLRRKMNDDTPKTPTNVSKIPSFVGRSAIPKYSS